MTAARFGFTLKATNGKARAGVIETPHGVVDTPAFMPVATQGSVKGVTPQELRELGAGIILGNTYHLYLRPGIEVIEAAGGLHEFMGWKGPILTDSGGFQAFSLRAMARLTDEAVVFRSHLDGSLHRFTPAAAVAYQERLGVDVMMCLDQCVAADGSEEAVREAMERTHRWAARCRTAWKSSRQALFGIVQGGISEEMRQESAEFITGLDFPGYAVGGLAVGETKTQMYEMLSFTGRVTSAGQAALSDGRRVAGRLGRVRGAGHGYVRLRLTHEGGAQRGAVHSGGTDKRDHGALSKGPGAGAGGVRLAWRASASPGRT